MTLNEIWDEIVRCSGSTIELSDKSTFIYTVTENSIFIPKTNWRITKAELKVAVANLQNPKFARIAEKQQSYVYAILFTAINSK